MRNNASFGTPPDGGNGRMRMFVWEGGGQTELLTVVSPLAIAGKYRTGTTSSDWGAAITNVPFNGTLVQVDDGTGNGSQGCNTLINAEDVNGKIALIDRGNCEFGVKALNAQNAGAIGFVICNFQEGTLNMGAGLVGGQVSIPGVFLSNSDCQRIKPFLDDGVEVSFVNENAGDGPTRLDASFDNGIVAHEYGHGISNRLTGGPTVAGCLNNFQNNGNTDGEQMGEGWSDFFTLVTSVRQGDTGETPRGIGTYSSKEPPTGGGIRPFPYSTDMSINPVTYDDIAFLSVPHGVGSVWCSILWDLYWKLTEKFGFDPDLYGIGGNNLAVQLVMDGMKMQTCDPGFEDGRDGILAADLALTGGQNQKEIWEVFARRGVGYDADQGSNERRLDNSEGFEIDPRVSKELRVTKLSTPLITPGDEYDVTLYVANHKIDPVTGVMAMDVIPEGGTYVEGSANVPAEMSGSTVTFEVGAIQPGDTTTITYSVISDNLSPSIQKFYDNMENDVFNWDISIDEGFQFWQLQEFIANSGSFAWGIENTDTSADQSLFNLDPILIDGKQPVLRFYHNWQTEAFFDAGIVQVSTDGGFTYDYITSDKIFRGNYSGKLEFGLFAIPNSRGFHGESDGWIATYVDLSDYLGEEVHVRFRFGSDGNTPGLGWFMDDFEIMDMYNYDSEVMVTSVEGDLVTATAEQRGTIAQSRVVSSTNDPEAEGYTFKAFPNPSRGQFQVAVAAPANELAYLRLFSGTGQLVWSEKLQLGSSLQNLSVRIPDLPGGLYVLKLDGTQAHFSKKLIIQN